MCEWVSERASGVGNKEWELAGETVNHWLIRCRSLKLNGPGQAQNLLVSAYGQTSHSIIICVCISKSNAYSRFIFIHIYFLFASRKYRKTIFKNAEWEKRFLFPRLAYTDCYDHWPHQLMTSYDFFLLLFSKLKLAKFRRARVAYFPIHFFVTLHPNVWPFFDDGIKVFNVILRAHTYTHASLT